MSLSPSGPSSSKPRIHVLDFIRFVAMLLMIQGHTLDAFVDPARMNLDSFHWQTWVQLRGLTAPLFLMVSGAATVLGIKYEADGRISRALLRRRIVTAFTVIGIGYLMVFPAHRLADLRWVSKDIWRVFLQVNILQLNGVSLLLLTTVLTFAKTVRRYAAWSLGLGCLILLASPIVSSVDWFRFMPESMAAFLSFNHGSLFPLFPAGAYMFLGVGLGAILLRTPEDRRVRTFRLASLTASVAFLVLAMVAGRIPSNLFPPHDAYKAGWAYTCYRLGFALLIFGILAWVAELKPRLTAACAPLGRKSLAVYVGHIILIYGTPWTIGLVTDRFHALSVGQGAWFVPLVGGITFAAVLLWDWIRKRSTTMGTLLHASAVFALAYVLVF